jgi:hypothetical protein
MLTDERITMKNKISVNTNNALLNVISPIGLDFNKNSLVVGENYGKIYGVVKYPAQPDYGWLSKLTNIPGTMVSYTFTPIDNGEFIEALNKNISYQRGAENATKDTLTRQRAKKAADDGENLMYQIDQNGETVGMLSALIMPFANDPDVFDKVRRKAVSTCLASRCKIRLLSDLQKNGFKQLSPMYTTEEDIQQITERIVPLSAVMGGFANSSAGYNDGNGYYMAKDASGGLLILDLWKRAGDRTNTNLVVMGVQGQGKSTVLKSIGVSEYMMGTKIIFTDPDREYKDLCHNLNGDWINAGGGVGGRINPLEIKPVPKDDDNDEVKLYVDNGFGMGDMALYLKWLDVFHSLYKPSLNDVEKALLTETLIELYNKFNIYWNTDINTLKSTDYPIYSDLHAILKEKADRSSMSEIEANAYKKLEILFRDIAKGADSILWNGYTDLKTSTRCICLDTFDLKDASNNIKRAQYFNINSWVWKVMSADRNERVLAFYDEAHQMIDPAVPQSLIHLRNTSKGARKFESGIAVISHSVVDFLDPSIKMYGQSLLDSPCYKIIFGSDGQNLKETCNLYNLTSAEEELLLSKRRGHALMMIGSKRMHVNFDIPEYKFKYFGTAGGR